ncbi:ABC transporter substrate-binding protein [Oceanobacillus manasiensis]|uniref:ABC transporter substrate-binding protein n=1 Tax=Oceanobacillus manasiensis TaxID=586413 RepID=UPI0005A79382|nr:ABC transporter substrate-binding protein [Oceanobacillus manasiensis]
MKLLGHYEVLSRSLDNIDEEVFITVEEIARILSCSYRNAKIIIKHLQEKNWIEWKPGKGRGNYSTLKLLQNIDILVMEQVKASMTPHSIDESLKLLNKFQVKHSLQREFIDWVFHSYLSEQRDLASDRFSRLHFPSYRSLPILDPAFVCRRSENHIMRHIFSQLVQFNENTNSFLPHLAHFWEHNQDHTKWVFYLQKGVRFHHGKEMTAEDVCYSFRRHKKTSAYSWMVEDLEKITVHQSYKVEFLFQKPCPYFLHLAASLGGSILPKDTSSSSATPIGTGPYRISNNTEETLTLTVFHDYFLRRPFLEEICIYFFPQLYDNTDAIDSLSNNFEMNFYHYPYLGRQIHHFDKYTVLDKGSKLLTLNRKKGILAKDFQLRKAIFHFISPDRMIKELGGTRYKKASHLLEKYELEEPCHFTETGRESLAKSNYNGEILLLGSYNGAGNEADAKWIRKELLKEGIHVAIRFYTYDQFQSLSLEEVDLLLGEQLSYESDLYTYLSAFKGGHNLLPYHLPPTVKEIQTVNDSEGDVLSDLRGMENNLMKENQHIPLYRIIQSAFFPSYVKGVHFNSLGWIDFTKIWYKDT